MYWAQRENLLRGVSQDGLSLGRSEKSFGRNELRPVRQPALLREERCAERKSGWREGEASGTAQECREAERWALLVSGGHVLAAAGAGCAPAIRRLAQQGADLNEKDQVEARCSPFRDGKDRCF